jgi:hypothetical protein
VSSPYPEIRHWIVPDAAKGATLNGVRPSGHQGNESGAFWLGVREAVAPVTAVVLPQGKGVEESPGQWRVSPEVFGAITRWAKPRGLALLGIAHTHIRGGPARLSWADRYRSVRVPGILAVVIGNGGEDDDHFDWGWYVYEEDDYRELCGDELRRRVHGGGAATLEVWRADSAGVWTLKG